MFGLKIKICKNTKTYQRLGWNIFHPEEKELITFAEQNLAPEIRTLFCNIILNKTPGEISYNGTELTVKKWES